MAWTGGRRWNGGGGGGGGSWHKNVLLCLSLLLNACFLSLHYLENKSNSSSSSSSALLIASKGDSFGSIMSNNDTFILHPNNANLTYGHVHVAKTAGTEINGLLAHYFERVCGHKGYSYDYYQMNQRAANVVEQKGKISVTDLKDSFTMLREKFNRGRVPFPFMDEIGYEDCDYVSIEKDWHFWQELARSTTVELHVPCRDPIQHLMSQCNQRSHRFNCRSRDLKHEIDRCMAGPGRFSLELQQEPHIHLKCFDPIPVDNYLQYMSERLQKKKVIPSYFVHRDSNKPRNKNKECIWDRPDIQTRVREIMENQYDYYKFCQQCTGSKDELPLK